MQLHFLTILATSVISITNAFQVVQLSGEDGAAPRTLKVYPSSGTSSAIRFTDPSRYVPGNNDEDIWFTYFNLRKPPPSNKPVVQVRFEDGTIGYSRITTQGVNKVLTKLVREQPPGPLASERELLAFLGPAPAQRVNAQPAQRPAQPAREWDASPWYPFADWTADLVQAPKGNPKPF